MSMRDINDIIDEAIKHLSDDNIRIGGESLVELAEVFAAAGLGRESFQNVRKYIIDEAKKRTDSVFIDIKLRYIEKEMYEQRNRTDKGKAWTKASGRKIRTTH